MTIIRRSRFGQPDLLEERLAAEATGCARKPKRSRPAPCESRFYAERVSARPGPT